MYRSLIGLALLGALAPLTLAQDAPKKLPFSERTILVFGFDGSDRKAVESVAACLKKAYGVKVEVLKDRPKPDTDGVEPIRKERLLEIAKAMKLKADSSTSLAELEKMIREPLRKRKEAEALALLASLDIPQLHVDTLIKQAGAFVGDRLKDPAVLGLVAVTHADLIRADVNFFFGASTGRVGVVSPIRFADKNAGLVLRRLQKQALSTGGFILGLKRCATADCARAYPNNLKEHDAKKDGICKECQAGLQKLKES